MRQLTRSSLRTVLKWTVIIVLVDLMAFGMAILALIQMSPCRGRGTGFYDVTEIEESLRPCIRLSMHHSNMSSIIVFAEGNIYWNVASAENSSVQSLENIHAVMYAIEVPYKDTVCYDIEFHYVLYKDNFSLPNRDAVVSYDIVIPEIGIDNPRYAIELSLNYNALVH